MPLPCPMRFFLLSWLVIALPGLLSSQVLSESNLPIIRIETNGQAILDDPKIMASMDIIYNGPGLINRITDPPNHYSGKIGIEVRGQSSQQFPMKSYGIELWNNSGSSIKRSLFGLPSESDWILYAPYSDKSLMRNVLAYHLSNQLGRWATRTIAVELILNGDYRGIYWVMEKIKRDGGRVAITKLNPGDVSGDALTGGYIISLDKEADGWFSAEPTIPAGGFPQYSFVVPKRSALAPAQQQYIQQYVDSFERALQATNYQDVAQGWRRFANDSSFVDFFLIQELSRNVDGYRLSSYFHKDRLGKLQAGPVWDFDLAFRNANYCRGSDTTGWAWQFNYTCSGDYWQVPFWWERITRDTLFHYQLRCRWNELRQTVFSENCLFSRIDSIISLTASARVRHFQRWPILGVYVWPNPQPIATSYLEECALLKNWISARLRWLDEQIPTRGPCVVVDLTPSHNFHVKITPNPIQGKIRLRIQSNRVQQLQIRLLQTNGSNVYGFVLPVDQGVSVLTKQLPVLARGIYWCEISDGSIKQVIPIWVD